MNWHQVEGNWKQLKGRARKRWGKLTDDELDEIRGRREILAGKLQERYGRSLEEAEEEADTWLKTIDEGRDAGNGHSDKAYADHYRTGRDGL